MYNISGRHIIDYLMGISQSMHWT